MSDMKGQNILTAQDIGAVAVADLVYAVVGTTKTKLVRPTGATILVMMCESGTFRARIGDHSGTGDATMPAAATPTASDTTGVSGIKIPSGSSVVIPSPSVITVVGYSNTDALTYYWL
jgi:hypothetical protein